MSPFFPIGKQLFPKTWHEGVYFAPGDPPQRSGLAGLGEEEAAVPGGVHHQQHVLQRLGQGVGQEVGAGRGAELAHQVQDGEPEGGEGGEAGEGRQVLEEHLGQHHGGPQLGLLPALVRPHTPQLQQLPQHGKQNSEERKLPLKGR